MTDTATEHAMPQDFARWREQAKQMTDEELIFVIRDCRKAAEAMRGWNPVKEGYYEDQAFTYSDERFARSAKKMKQKLLSKKQKPLT